jgi:hypothetical protein
MKMSANGISLQQINILIKPMLYGHKRVGAALSEKIVWGQPFYEFWIGYRFCDSDERQLGMGVFRTPTNKHTPVPAYPSAYYATVVALA